jgi:hypothetical protein
MGLCLCRYGFVIKLAIYGSFVSSVSVDRNKMGRPWVNKINNL